MAHPIQTAQTWRRRPRQVGRTRHRPWARTDEIGADSTLLARIPSLPRSALARLTMLLIDRMDEIDGDSDFEDLRDDDEDPHDREDVYE